MYFSYIISVYNKNQVVTKQVIIGHNDIKKEYYLLLCIEVYAPAYRRVRFAKAYTNTPPIKIILLLLPIITLQKVFVIKKGIIKKKQLYKHNLLKTCILAVQKVEKYKKQKKLAF